MRCVLTLAGVMIACVLGSMGAAHGQDGKGEPFELVRSLQSLQDQVVRGNTRAHAAQRVLLAHIAEQFDALKPEGWKDPKNARAAVVFVLSGGSARALQKLVRSGASTDINEKLLKGTLAYGEGRHDEAAELLASVEARALDPGTAGLVAYVQGELAAKKEPAKALVHFDDARLLAPGTIVEEAALRRQIALLAASGNAVRYEALATQYLRRFPQLGVRRRFPAAVCLGDCRPYGCGGVGPARPPGTHAGRCGPVGPARGVSDNRQGSRRQGQDGDGEIRCRKCPAASGSR